MTTETKSKLTPLEGREVLSATIAIRNAGDGLSQAMEVDPTELHHGETVYVVLECLVEKLRFDPIDKSDGLQRVHMLKAGRATMVDGTIVSEALDRQQAKIDAAQGSPQLPGIADGSAPARPRGEASEPTPVGDAAARLAADLEADRAAAEAEADAAGADLAAECATCRGPVEDGRCLMQDCDVVVEGDQDQPPAPAEGDDPDAWEASARREPSSTAPLSIEDLVVVDGEGLDVNSSALQAARVSEVVDVVGRLEEPQRAKVAGALWRAERAGKARTTLLGGLEQLAGDHVPRSA